MKVRLALQMEGIAKPSDDVKAATAALVDKPSAIDASESIKVAVSEGVASYVRVSIGQVLAKIYLPPE